jgi:hypothetical protein
LFCRLRSVLEKLPKGLIHNEKMQRKQWTLETSEKIKKLFYFAMIGDLKTRKRDADCELHWVSHARAEAKQKYKSPKQFVCILNFQIFQSSTRSTRFVCRPRQSVNAENGASGAKPNERAQVRLGRRVAIDVGVVVSDASANKSGDERVNRGNVGLGGNGERDGGPRRMAASYVFAMAASPRRTSAASGSFRSFDSATRRGSTFSNLPVRFTTMRIASALACIATANVSGRAAKVRTPEPKKEERDIVKVKRQ